jgi:DNA-binding GntR family transcriptional regulator
LVVFGDGATRSRSYNCRVAFAAALFQDRLVDRVAELLRDRIVEGIYAPGEPLPRGRLADELNVGETVVGEALRILGREGLVLPGAHGKLCVAGHERSFLMDAHELRAVIDGLGARLAAQRGGPAERALHDALDEQRQALVAGDARRFVRGDIAFHAAVLACSGNVLLQHHIAPLVRWTCRTVTVDERWMREVLAEHEAVLAAVLSQQPDEAERAAKAHIEARALAAFNGSARRTAVAAVDEGSKP